MWPRQYIYITETAFIPSASRMSDLVLLTNVDQLLLSEDLPKRGLGESIRSFCFSRMDPEPGIQMPFDHRAGGTAWLHTFFCRYVINFFGDAQKYETGTGPNRGVCRQRRRTGISNAARNDQVFAVISLMGVFSSFRQRNVAGFNQKDIRLNFLNQVFRNPNITDNGCPLNTHTGSTNWGPVSKRKCHRQISWMACTRILTRPLPHSGKLPQR
jgi:hypothetical protein